MPRTNPNSYKTWNPKGRFESRKMKPKFLFPELN